MIAVPVHWNVNVRVGSADAIVGSAGAPGGTVMMRPFDTPAFRNAVVADAEGAVFLISEPRV